MGNQRGPATRNRPLAALAMTALVGLAVLVSSLTVLPGVVGAANQISSCTTISTPGQYNLTQSQFDVTTSDCIRITASDVVFDGRNHVLQGNRNHKQDGINVSDPGRTLTNVTVKNVTVKTWDRGVRYHTAENGRIWNIDADNSDVGILVRRSDGTDLLQTDVSDNINWGLRLEKTRFSVVRDSVGTNSTHGFTSNRGDIKFIDNTASRNGISGFLVSGLGFDEVRNVTFRRNTANNGGGFSAESSSTFINNTAKNNTGDSFHARNRNVFVNNTALNNTHGIRVRDHNTLRNNDLGLADKFAFAGRTNNTGTAVAIGSSFTPGTTVDFDQRWVDVRSRGSIPTPPGNFQDIGRALSASHQESGIRDHLFLNVSFDYKDGDVGPDVDETSLSVWRYNITNASWREVGGTVDTAANTVRGNVTHVDDHRVRNVSVIAPLASPNTPPTANFTFSPSAPQAGDSVAFDASASEDSEGGIIAYDWSFGDGTNTAGPNPSHTYDAADDYTVELTVTDDDGATATATRTVSVSPADNTTSDETVDVSPDSEDGDHPAEEDDGQQQDASGETTTAVQTTQEDGQTRVQATVQNAQEGEPVEMQVASSAEAAIDPETAPAQLTSISVTPATDATFSLEIRESPEPLPSSPTFNLGDGTTPVSYLSVEHTLPNADIEQATMTYRVSEQSLEVMDSSPEDVSMYRYEGGSWAEQPTQVVGMDDGAAILQTTTDRLSEWTAAAKRPRLNVTDTQVSVQAATTEETVTIQVFVTNTGGTDGVYEAELFLNDETVDRAERTVPDGGTVAVNFERTFAQPGLYEVRVNDVFVGEVNISAADESVEVETAANASVEAQAPGNATDADGGGGGGFPVVPAGIVLVLGAGLGVWLYMTRIAE